MYERLSAHAGFTGLLYHSHCYTSSASESEVYSPGSSAAAAVSGLASGVGVSFSDAVNSRTERKLYRSAKFEINQS